MDLKLGNKNYIKIIKPVEFLNKGEVYQVSFSQNNITKGLEVVDDKGVVRLVSHGSYEDYKPEETKVETETEEKIFSIILEDKSDILSDLIKDTIQQVKEETTVELSWSLEEFVFFPCGRESTMLLRLTTIKDSHIHNSTPLWLAACKDFACKLQTVLKQEGFRAYVTDINLYSFSNRKDVIHN